MTLASTKTKPKEKVGEKQKTLEEASTIELKALIYDESAKMQATQNNINIINKEIQKRTR